MELKDPLPETKPLLAELAREMSARGLRCAVAESLTGGLLAAHLASAPDSGEWFLGGVVAYQVRTKVRVLGVEPGPVVTTEAAAQMAAGVAELTGADLAVALSGVGGPGSEEGQPAGTVCLGLHIRGGAAWQRTYRFEGEDPEMVLAQSVLAGLRALREGLGVRSDD